MFPIKNDLRDRQKIVRLIFIGRLESEKGFDRVMEVCAQILDSGLPATCSVYGEGSLKESFLAGFRSKTGFLDASDGAFPQGGEQVVYYGHRDWQSIQDALAGSHYILMPSRFLETFGLSALEAESYGVPVIGIKKGGLAQFLLSEHAVSSYRDDRVESEAFIAKTLDIIRNFSPADWKRQSFTARDIAARYIPEKWIERIAGFAP